MEHEWRKYPTLNDTVMACHKCGDVKRDKNRPCPGRNDQNDPKGSKLTKPIDFSI